LNLRTAEESYPIYVSLLLTLEEENECFNLLLENNNVFAWSYKEMPGLEPKVAVHFLSLRREVSDIFN